MSTASLKWFEYLMSFVRLIVWIVVTCCDILCKFLILSVPPEKSNSGWMRRNPHGRLVQAQSELPSELLTFQIDPRHVKFCVELGDVLSIVTCEKMRISEPKALLSLSENDLMIMLCSTSTFWIITWETCLQEWSQKWQHEGAEWWRTECGTCSSQASSIWLVNGFLAIHSTHQHC